MSYIISYFEDLRNQARIGGFIKRKMVIAITARFDGDKTSHTQGDHG